jgi:hypothetical protein
VIRDGDKYRAWYMNGLAVGYAESPDGISWVKPQLDLVTVDGQKTNLLFRKATELIGPDELPYYHELFGVFRDDRELDPSRRYKMGILSIDFNYGDGPRAAAFNRRQRRGLGVAGSPDGIHWKRIDNWATEAICDGVTQWMLDPVSNKFVMFGRTGKTLPEVEAAWSKYDWYKHWHSGRAVARVESDDFVKWNYVDPNSAPVVLTATLEDDPGTEIYSIKVIPYESVYIGIVQVFHATPETCYLDQHLAVSHDGVHFTRLRNQPPFLPTGGVGEWDRFNQSLSCNPPIAVGDELRFYYGGRTYRHSPYNGPDTAPKAGAIGFASMPRDRFVSLESSFDGGEIMTRPLKLEGRTLHMNGKSDFGEILVEILPASGGDPLARSAPIQRDSLDTTVEWASGSIEPGQTVRLRILLKNACLFALWSS